VSLSALRTTLFPESAKLPDEDIVCGRTLWRQFCEPIAQEYEIQIMRIFADERRVDCGWGRKATPPRWADVDSLLSRFDDREVLGWIRKNLSNGIAMLVHMSMSPVLVGGRLGHLYRDMMKTFVQLGEVEVEGPADTLCVVAHGGKFFLLPAGGREALTLLVKQESIEGRAAALCLTMLVATMDVKGGLGPALLSDAQGMMDNAKRDFKGAGLELSLVSAFEELIRDVTERASNIFAPDLWPIFDSWHWRDGLKGADCLGSGVAHGENVVPRMA
jgi:hypothetical protein